MKSSGRFPTDHGSNVRKLRQQQGSHHSRPGGDIPFHVAPPAVQNDPLATNCHPAVPLAYSPEWYWQPGQRTQWFLESLPPAPALSRAEGFDLRDVVSPLPVYAQ